MDMTKSDNSIFKRPRGCYLSQAKAVALFCFCVLAAVAVGVITYYAVKCDDATEVQQSEAQGSDGKDSEGKPFTVKVKDVRLPTNIKPLYYKVDLIPYIDEAKNFTIDGKVWIDVQCLEDSDKVTIHIKNITVAEESVRIGEIQTAEEPVDSTAGNDNMKSFRIMKHGYDVPREFYNISLDASLERGKIYRIYIPFTAILDDSLGGFYRSSYNDKTTKEKR